MKNLAILQLGQVFIWRLYARRYLPGGVAEKESRKQEG